MDCGSLEHTGSKVGHVPERLPYRFYEKAQYATSLTLYATVVFSPPELLNSAVGAIVLGLIACTVLGTGYMGYKTESLRMIQLPNLLATPLLIIGFFSDFVYSGLLAPEDYLV